MRAPTRPLARRLLKQPHVNALLERYLALLARRPRATLLAVLALATLAVPLAATLRLRSSLKELLPSDSPSVRALDRVIERVGGVGNLIVAVESPDPRANQRFADDLAEGLRRVPAGWVRYVDYRVAPVERFYEEHGLLYLSAPELARLRDEIARTIRAEKARANPFFVDLDARPSLDLDALTRDKRREDAGPVRVVDGYYGGDDGRLLILLVRPFGTNMSVDASRELVARVQAVARGLDPARYHPQLTVGYTGTFMTAIEEYEALRRDIVSTAAECVLLVVAAIALYFFRLRPAALLGATLAAALTWTFALTRLTIGYLNSQTAFLGSIILGTGINYGIVLLGRYDEERADGRAAAAAMRCALLETAQPTLLAAASTAFAFGVLLVGGVRSLAQFGFIGGSGILLCWLSTVTVLPALTLAAERLPGGRPRPPRRPAAPWRALARVIDRSPQTVVVASLALLAASAVVLVRFAPDAIEYDFGKLRNRVSHTDELDRKVGRLFASSTVPTVIHVDSAAEAREVAELIARRVAAQPEAARVVDSCTTIADLLPRDLDAKRPILAAIDRLLADPWIDHLSARDRERIARARRAIAAPPLTIEDLPEELARSFTDRAGRRGTVLFVNPRRDRYFSDGHNLIAFADTLRGLRLSDGRVVDAAGDATVFADLIAIIEREAPLLTLASLLAVIALVIVSVRDVGAALAILVSLGAGVGLMLGACAVAGIRVNFFNFIILPLTIGIGVDYALNVALRLGRERRYGLAHVLRHTGGAVTLASLTTIIGYGVLTRADNQALASFGTAAILGEVACLAAALLLAPSLVLLHRRGLLFRPCRWFSAEGRLVDVGDR
jgi:predicted RND superfamily exporter protein